MISNSTGNSPAGSRDVFGLPPLTDGEHACMPTIEWLAEHEHEELIGAALERAAAGRSTFADARLLALEIGLARAGCHHGARTVDAGAEAGAVGVLTGLG